MLKAAQRDVEELSEKLERKKVAERMLRDRAAALDEEMKSCLLYTSRCV